MYLQNTRKNHSMTLKIIKSSLNELPFFIIKFNEFYLCLQRAKTISFVYFCYISCETHKKGTCLQDERKGKDKKSQKIMPFSLL